MRYVDRLTSCADLQIDVEGARLIAAALAKNVVLDSLTFVGSCARFYLHGGILSCAAGCELGRDGVDALLACLEDNMTLQHLHIRGVLLWICGAVPLVV
jgi:hypothetical protein